MLTHRIIPCLDVDQGRVVKGINFLNISDVGDPTDLAIYYNNSGADELVFLDITASSDNRNIMVDVVKKVSSEVFIPLTVGGGIRTKKDMQNMLEAGADKVSINSAAVNNPKLIEDCAKEFGSQCVVLAMDVKKHDKQWNIFTHGGRNNTNINALEWAKKATELGAGELLVTSMDTDGKKTGYDTNLLYSINKLVNIPIIASGGAGEQKHFYDAIVDGKADAVLAASLFHYKEITINDLKKYLTDKNIPIRL